MFEIMKLGKVLNLQFKSSFSHPPFLSLSLSLSSPQGYLFKGSRFIGEACNHEEEEGGIRIPCHLDLAQFVSNDKF